MKKNEIRVGAISEDYGAVMDIHLISVLRGSEG